MKLLSIDVGVKNLAYCLFTINDKDSYTIDDWKVVNLCNEKKKLCNSMNSKKKQCTRRCKYYKNDEYYCKIHAKNKQYGIPTEDMLCYSKFKLVDLKKKFDLQFRKKSTKKECLQIIKKHIGDYYFNVIRPVKVRDLSMIKIGRNLKKFFDNFFKNIVIDTVIIESQIGPIANRMKTLEGMIIQHFIENGCQNIAQISSANKLKLFVKKKTSYRERKDLGIKITRHILMENDPFLTWKETFNQHKKKDDLADCFLQGLWYLNNSKNIIFNYSLRLT